MAHYVSEHTSYAKSWFDSYSGQTIMTSTIVFVVFLCIIFLFPLLYGTHL